MRNASEDNPDDAEKTLQRIPIVTMKAGAPHRTKMINLILKTFLSFYQAMEQINKELSPRDLSPLFNIGFSAKFFKFS